MLPSSYSLLSAYLGPCCVWVVWGGGGDVGMVQGKGHNVTGLTLPFIPPLSAFTFSRLRDRKRPESQRVEKRATGNVVFVLQYIDIRSVQTLTHIQLSCHTNNPPSLPFSFHQDDTKRENLCLFILG